mmetsp:Transcript_44299/g.115124  ORF Transcript_44299/g.115124 Transcript_44299/m.115124 type:complete len:94 (-) Transcript_44299:60-341(-)
MFVCFDSCICIFVRGFLNLSTVRQGEVRADCNSHWERFPPVFWVTRVKGGAVARCEGYSTLEGSLENGLSRAQCMSPAPHPCPSQPSNMYDTK